MKKTAQTVQAQWSSKWAFIFAATGAAVGLGNIWRFPYLMGSNGGSAFLVLYIIFLCILGLPILMSEILIGRHARQNSIDAMSSLAVAHRHSPSWKWVSIWGALALIIVLSFYSVVSGWSIAYLWHSISVGFQHTTQTQATHTWQKLISNPWQLLLWHTIFMSLTIGVIILGVEKGLERATKFMMPALYLILFILVAVAAHVGHFSKAWHYLFQFDTHAITVKTAVSALGQAFFTLAIGAGAMLTYGAYAPQKTSIPFTVSVVAVFDVLVALLSGLAIFPLVFAFHLPISSGPNLMFVTLPLAFSHVALGNVIAMLFFLLLLFAAWTSSINLAEPLVLVLMQKMGLSRSKAAKIIGFIAWTIGIANILSFNVWKHIHIFHQSIFDFNANMATNIILPLGGLGYAIFAGWILPKKITQSEIQSKIYPIWRFLIRYIAPAAIIIIFIDGILS
tara:strand:+ start:986 stop:2335 length:1350 start_codon:yes stop_codon:yes gene_type:complete